MSLLQQTTHRMLVRHDAEVGHLYLPHLRARLPNENGGYFVVTNAQGFRSDIEFAKDRGVRPRILFFGDAFTAGDGCHNIERFSDRVGELVSAETYNYAVSGAGTDQQLLVYEKHARGVQADLVVVCVHVEDIERVKVAHRESTDRLTGRRVLVPKPYFKLEGSRLALHNAPLSREAQAATTAGGVSHDPLERLISKPLSRWKDDPRLKAARNVVKERLPWLVPAVLKQTRFQPHRDYESAESDGWRLMQAILARFCESASPTPVLIVPIPTYYFYHDGLEPLYQPLFERLSAPSRGVHVMDLTRPLYQLPWEDKKRLAFKDGGHFSPFGHGEVARVIADTIKTRGLLRRSISADMPALSTPMPMTLKSTNGTGPVGAYGTGGIPATGGGRGPKPMYILGISCFRHDSAAALIKDGEIIAAAEEERFSRVAHDRRFPARAANYCLEEGGINPRDLSAVVYSDNAPLAFERTMHSLAAVALEGRDAWARALPGWLRHKLHVPQLIRKHLVYDGLVLQAPHHRSQAASAFFPSPFDRAAVVTLDGVGEWATASIGAGHHRELKLLQETHFPGSLGLLYSAFTQFTGFEVDAGEHELMALAAHGEAKYQDQILKELVDLKEDGSIQLNMDYFAFLSQPAMTNDRFARLLGGPARRPGDRITQREMDLARSIQAVTEEALLRTARHAKKLTGEKKLCLAGSMALNCVANGRLLREGPFEDLWIQPAAGDAGGALGAALDAYHTYFERPRTMPTDGRPRQSGSFLGPEYRDSEIQAFLDTQGYPYQTLDPLRRGDEIAGLLANGKVVGHVAGRLEFGPRSLGARSILADVKIKPGEGSLPFTPSVLFERASEYFELNRESPYMLVTARVKERRRADLPAVTHVDGSARVQTVVRSDHPQYHDLLKAVEKRTGHGVLASTSFNARGEPIVCTPDDAYRCFMRTGMDYLVLGNFLLDKSRQPAWSEPRGDSAVEPRDTPDDAFVDAVSGIFAFDFLPAVSGLPRGSVRIPLTFQKSATAWAEVREPASGKALFSIPPALDSTAPDPARMAEAITAFWEPGAATDAMRRVLVKLLEVSKRFPS